MDIEAFDRKSNYVFDKDEDVRMLLFAIGMPNGLPHPMKASGSSRCGYTLFAKETEDHYVTVWRHCNCNNITNGNYSAMMLSKETNTSQQAIDMQMAIMKKIGTDFHEMTSVEPINPKTN